MQIRNRSVVEYSIAVLREVKVRVLTMASSCDRGRSNEGICTKGLEGENFRWKNEEIERRMNLKTCFLKGKEKAHGDEITISSG